MRCSEIVNILEILRLSELGLTHREIAASVKCGKTTVGDVKKRCENAELTYAVAKELSNTEIEKRLYPSKAVAANKPPPDWESVHKWLKSGKRRNLQYAWEEYRLKEPNGLGYSQYCRQYKIWKDTTGKTVAMVQTHEPGDKMFLDWVGDTLDCVVDPDSGEVFTAHFFVAVLGYSCYPYVEAFPNEQMESWLTANINALEYFGGVPRVAVPDNTKTATTRPEYYDTKINPAYLEFSKHYGIAIIPARPYKPRDKGVVEGSVGWLETWLLEWLRGQRFFSFAELNAAIRERVKALAERPFKKRYGSRAGEFREIERSALRPLPPTRYDLAKYVTRRVPDSYHVEYDAYYYSVPYSLYKQIVTIRATSTMIEIINDNRERVALHVRRYSGSRYITEPSHMTEAHRRQAEFSCRTGADYLSWAAKIGSGTKAVIERMLRVQVYEETAYRGCMGVLQLSKKYSDKQLEIACNRALEIGSPCYTTVRSILQNPPVKRVQPLPIHENLRSPAEFS
jgi:transposase